jgi:hypothetical protein
MRTLELGPARVSQAPGSVSSGAAARNVHDSRGETLIGQLELECEAMARYALQHGLPVQSELIAQLSAQIEPSAMASAQQPLRSRELALMHRKLAHAVAPATPQGITLLDVQRRRYRRFGWLGPVPLIRLLTLAAVSFLIAVVATALPAEVSTDNMERGFLASSGTTLLWNTLFLLCSAGLGASFAALFQAHRYVANSTYDPKYDASYGARVILGVIAGLILVQMLPAQMFNSGGMHSFGKPALAMLGGFSATAVHRVLQRLVETIETLVRGDQSAQLYASIGEQRAHAATERIQSQSDLAARLLELQQSLDAGTSPQAVKQQLAAFTRAMLSTDQAEPAYAAGAAAPSGE